MAMRLGPGPVFVYEWLATARRWQTYAMRAGFVGIILIGLAFTSNGLAAAITSLGLAVATRVSRLGRAIALCVTVYAVLSIGWPVMIAVLCRPDPIGRSLVIGSPAIGAFAGAFMITPESLPHWRVEYQGAAVLWILAHLAMAKGLFAMTIARFDRCVGRARPHSDFFRGEFG